MDKNANRSPPEIERPRPHAQVERVAAGERHAALLDRRVALQTLHDRAERAAHFAGVGVAAPALRLRAVDATGDFTRTPPPELRNVGGTEKIQRRLVGENDLTRGIHRQQDVGDRVHEAPHFSPLRDLPRLADHAAGIRPLGCWRKFTHAGISSAASPRAQPRTS